MELLGIFFIGWLLARAMVNAERAAGRENRAKVPARKSDKYSNKEKI